MSMIEDRSGRSRTVNGKNDRENVNIKGGAAYV